MTLAVAVAVVVTAVVSAGAIIALIIVALIIVALIIIAVAVTDRIGTRAAIAPRSAPGVPPAITGACGDASCPRGPRQRAGGQQWRRYEQREVDPRSKVERVGTCRHVEASVRLARRRVERSEGVDETGRALLERRGRGFRERAQPLSRP